MVIISHTPVRCRYNSRRRGVVEALDIQTRGCGRGADERIQVRWDDGPITEVGAGDIVELTNPPAPPSDEGDNGGSK